MTTPTHVPGHACTTKRVQLVQEPQVNKVLDLQISAN